MKQMFTIGLKELQNKLIDTSRRNKLINYKRPSKTRNLKIIDESAEFIFNYLVKMEEKFKFKHIPEPPIDLKKLNKLKDERKKLKKIINSDLSTEKKKPIEEQLKKIEFELTELEKSLLTPEERAKELGFNISNELPEINFNLDSIDEKYIDSFLQTLHYPNEMEKILTNIERTYRSFIEETGTNMLYLVLGVLEWSESDFSDITNKSPLIAIPIVINKVKFGNHYTFTIEYSGEGLETNLSLAEKLLSDFNIILPELNEDIEFKQYLKEVKKVIKDKKSWKIKQEISLDFLHFGKILMYRDLQEKNWDDKLFENEILKDIFIGKETSESISLFADEYDIDNNETTNDIPLVMDADSSQHSAIIDVIEGKNIVIEGPPGTGKSQTISNIIASLLAKNKKILFVSEKLAALEVVQKRLESIGLADFCLELHSNKSKKTEVLHSIEKRLNSKYEDTNSLEHIIENIEYTKKQLREYLNIIHKKFGSINKAIYNILWLVELYRNGEKYLKFNIEDIKSYTNFDLTNILDELNKFEEFHKNYDFDNFFWKDFDLYKLDFIDIDELVFLLNELKKEYSLLNEKIKNIPILIENECEELKNIDNFFKSYKYSEIYDDNILSILNQNNQLFLDYNNSYAILLNTIEDLKEKLKEIKNIDDYNNQLILLIQEILSINKDLSIEFNISTNTDLLYNELLLKGFLLIEELGVTNYNKISNNMFNNPEVEALLYKLKNDFLKLKQKRKKIEEYSILEKINNFTFEEFNNLITIIEDKKDSFFSFFSSEYKKAFNKINDSLKETLPNDKKSWSEIFANLKEYIIVKDKINNSELYLLHFGEQFSGINTNINDLEFIINWIKKFKNLTNNKLENNFFLQNNQKYNNIIKYKNKLEKVIQDFLKYYNNIENIYDLMYLQENIGNNKLGNLEDLKLLIENNNKKIKLLKSFFSQELKVDIFSDNFTNLFISHIDSVDLEKISYTISKININFNDFSYRYNKFEKEILNIKNITNQLNSKYNLNLAFNKNSYFKIKETINLYNYIKLSNLSLELKNILYNKLECIDKLSEVNKAYQNIKGIKEKISKYGNISNNFFDKPQKIIECINKLDLVQENKNSLSIWSDFRKIAQSIKEKKFEKIVEYVENKKIPYEKIKDVFLFNFYNNLVKEIFREYPLLVNFNRLSHEQILNKFKILDKELIIQNRKKIASTVSKNKIPYGYSSNRVSELTELCLITHEISKKKRHIPIRKLIERAPSALQALKPCFMMSPLSVSQYLPQNKIEFDVLIVDEASQLKPEEALGSIARVKQVVIVGDPKQLPPTSFFASVNKEDEEESVAAESESILDISLNLYKPIRQLRWHYRSQHESLIDFSNKQFYDNNLLIFPSPKSINSNDFGIKHHYIENSVYNNRRNKIEATYLINQLEKQMKLYPNSSIGIGTFNSEQRDLIQDMIDEKEKNSPIISEYIAKWINTSEPFFVKNLENIQGDERDVIFISTTYGKDKESKKVYQRFGPINSDVGWRRLNVMFTRAKQKMEIFTSLSSSDIVVSENSSRGVRALKSFLKYVETSKQSEDAIITGKGFDSEFEESVYNLLNDIGYKTIPQVGVAGYYIDLAVVSSKNPNDFILAIECDGATYHSSKSARDRDRLKQEVLEKLGWNVYRIWSVDWYKNREYEISKLIEAIKKAEIEYNSIYDKLEKNKENIKEKSIFNKNEKISNQEHFNDFLSNEDIINKLKDIRDNKIAKEFQIDKRCILSDLMIELFVKHKPLNMDEFREKIPLRYRNINVIDIEQMKFMPDIFEVLEMAYD